MGQACGKIQGPTALLDAVQHSRLDVLKAAVQSGTGIDVALDNDGSTACGLAAKAGNTALVQVCLELKANPHAQDQNGDSIMHKAASSGNVDIVKLLVKQGCKVDQRRRDGCTPLHSAAESGSVEVCKALMDAKAQSVKGDYGSIDFKAFLNATNMKGTTALHLACQAGSSDVVRALLERNANPCAINSAAQAPIDCLSKDHKAFKEIQALLFEFGDEL
mmetsp:Transcript_30935/g.78959  ORF Transcript_30935/g.78959 Transcript_30935/m.78959 type:complete len:219 (-) Transcript_30935:358-1014(-)